MIIVMVYPLTINGISSTLVLNHLLLSGLIISWIPESNVFVTAVMRLEMHNGGTPHGSKLGPLIFVVKANDVAIDIPLATYRYFWMTG